MFEGVQYKDNGEVTIEYRKYLDTLDYQDVERINDMSSIPKVEMGKFGKFFTKLGTKMFGDAKQFERFDAKFSKAIGWNQKH